MNRREKATALEDRPRIDMDVQHMPAHAAITNLVESMHVNRMNGLLLNQPQSITAYSCMALIMYRPYTKILLTYHSIFEPQNQWDTYCLLTHNWMDRFFFPAIRTLLMTRWSTHSLLDIFLFVCF